MRRLKVTFLALSTLIVLLHSFTPHSHHDNPEETFLSSCNQATEPGILGLFQSIFHQDLGEEHLENFLHAEDFHFDFDFDAVTRVSFVLITCEIRIEKKDKVHVPYQFADKDRWQQSPLNFRGPPLSI